jgi:hypothetical protein
MATLEAATQHIINLAGEFSQKRKPSSSTQHTSNRKKSEEL